MAQPYYSIVASSWGLSSDIDIESEVLPPTLPSMCGTFPNPAGVSLLWVHSVHCLGSVAHLLPPPIQGEPNLGETHSSW